MIKSVALPRPCDYLDSAYKKRQTVDGNFSGNFTKKKSASKYRPKFSSGSSSTSFTGTASSDTGTSITYGAISIDSETLPQYTSDYCSDKECHGTVPLLLSPDKRISQTQFVPPLTCSKRYQKPATVIIPDFIDFSSVDLSRGRLNSVETIGSTASSESQERYFQDKCSKYAAKKELERSSSSGISPTHSSNKSVGFVKLATLTYGKPVPKRGRHRAVSFSQMITEEQGGRRVCHNSHFAGCVAAPLASALPSPPVAWVAQKTSDKSIGQFLQSICSGRQRSREVGDVSITRKNHGNKSRKANSHQSKQSSPTKQLPKSKPRDAIKTKSTTKPRRQFDHSRNQKHRGYSKIEKAEIHDNNKNDNKKIGILHKPDGSGDGPSSIPGNVMSFFEAFKQSSKK